MPNTHSPPAEMPHDELNHLRHELSVVRERLAITEQAYSSFVPLEFLHFLKVDNIRDVRLGMQIERVMSILFCDIRNFTGLSESMTPQENFDFLNSYLSQMGPVIVPYRGLIDKFIGDAIMALFPVCTDDAIAGALAMLQCLAKYNRGRVRAGYATLKIGIGINTGIVILGTVGVAHRMDTTVIGDAVNLASRLEGMTKTYDTPLVISEHTLYSLENPTKFRIRFLGRIRVRGKNNVQSVYEVFDADPPMLREAKLRTRKRFEEALAFLYSGEVAKARTRLIRCLQEAPGDRPAQIYLEKCEDVLRDNHFHGLDPIEFEQTWSDDYSSSISDIDSQHRALLTRMNFLSSAIREGRMQYAHALLADIIEETMKHNAMEEEMMRESRYPLLREHGLQHTCFYKHLSTIQAEIASGTENPIYLAFRVRLLLIDCLINHSIKADRHLGHYLKSRSFRSGMPQRA